MWNIQNVQTFFLFSKSWKAKDFNGIVKITCTHRKEKSVYHKPIMRNHESQRWIIIGMFVQWPRRFISRFFRFENSWFMEHTVMQISHLSLIHKLILEWFRGLFNIDFRKDEMIMQNHPFWNDSLSLSSFSLPTKNESFSRIFMLVHRFSSWFMMTMTHFHPFHSLQYSLSTHSSSSLTHA